MLRDWLLKDDEKNKVGRPKLATQKLINKSRIMVGISLLVACILFFSFLCIIKNENPLAIVYSKTLEKVMGPINKKDSFIVKEYYNNNSDFVMSFHVPSSVRKYDTSYKYTTYYLEKNKWKKHSEKTYDTYADDFKIIFKTKKNKNITWKVKLELVNCDKKVNDYSPYSWKFVNNEKAYTYKVFTTKGYYSPVSKSETKEQDKDKVYVYTNKDNPRNIIINMPSDLTYSYKVTYTDNKGTITDLDNNDNVVNSSIITVPNVERTTNVKIKIWIDGYDSDMLKDIKLSNWEIKTDSYGNSYITNTYLVKPKTAY